MPTTIAGLARIETQLRGVIEVEHPVDGSGPSMCIPGMPGFRCEGNEAIECRSDGSDGTRTNCVAAGQVCAEGIGCTVAQPNAGRRGGVDRAGFTAENAVYAEPAQRPPAGSRPEAADHGDTRGDPL